MNHSMLIILPAGIILVEIGAHAFLSGQPGVDTLDQAGIRRIALRDGTFAGIYVPLNSASKVAASRKPPVDPQPPGTTPPGTIPRACL